MLVPFEPHPSVGIGVCAFNKSHLLNVRYYHNLIDLYAYTVPSQYSSFKLVAIALFVY